MILPEAKLMWNFQTGLAMDKETKQVSVFLLNVCYDQNCFRGQRGDTPNS